MRWWPRRPEPPRPTHRGRIYWTGSWWRYGCYDCNFGAGSTGDGLGVVPVYIQMATRHARDKQAR